MKGTPGRASSTLLNWLTPTIGAVCFAVVMYAGVAIGSEHIIALGIGLMLLGIAAVIIGRKFTTPYSPPAFGVYIFAGGCAFMGAIFLAT